MHYLEEELLAFLGMNQEVFKFFDENIMDGIWYWDLENPQHEYLSPGFWKAFAIDPAEKSHLAEEWQSLIDPEHLQLARKNAELHLADENHPYDQVVCYRSNGNQVWVRCKGKAIRNSQGVPTRFIGFHVLVTELVEMTDRYEKLITKMDQVYANIKVAQLESDEQINAIPDALMHIDVAGFITYANKSARTLFGYTEDELLKLKVEHLVPHRARVNHVSYRTKYQKNPALREMGKTNLELKALRKNGEEFDVDVRLCPIETRRGLMTLAIVRDITENKILQRQLINSEVERQLLDSKSSTDYLTGLYNREYFLKVCEQNFMLAKRNARELSIVLIDVDDFKRFNDDYGHLVGDLVLVEISKLLAAHLRESDIIARFGGEEIILGLPETSLDSAQILINKLIYQLKKAQPFEEISENIGVVTISAGICSLNQQIKSLHELISKADDAMYTAKDQGKDRIVCV